MARTSEHDTRLAYQAARQFRESCLLTDGSLFFPERRIWRSDLLALIPQVIGTDESEKTFMVKLEAQLEGKDPDLICLMAELLYVYFLFPSAANIGAELKQATVEQVLAWADAKLPDSKAVARTLGSGIGNPGSRYNRHRPFELIFLARAALRCKELPQELRGQTLNAPLAFQQLVDGIPGVGSRQIRHIMLHLLFPDDFERIASGRHKEQIMEAFQDLLEDPTDNLDQNLRDLRSCLEARVQIPEHGLDFYRPPLSRVWYDQDDDGETGLSLGMLKHKKQIVLYGPPGTGKTYEARRLAERIIRMGALAQLGTADYFRRAEEMEQVVERNIHTLQLHPAYSYEDFIQGLHIGPDKATEYRPGSLPTLIATMGKEPEAEQFPHVLILDEMNRTDLSRMLGECFSLLENRDRTVDLPGLDKEGRPNQLAIPGRLYVIGTMNLIDQSVEQIDFALRRRFYWIPCLYREQSLTAIARVKWDRAQTGVEWSSVHKAFEGLAKAASDLNLAIRNSRALGPMYEVGHTYFTDAVEFLHEDLKPKPTSRSIYLYDRAGRPRKPMVDLWRFSLRPLLEQYLAGLDADARESELDLFGKTFLQPCSGAQNDGQD